MLFRRLPGGPAICVPQPAHAWISGPLARAWGDRRFGAAAARVDVRATLSPG